MRRNIVIRASKKLRFSVIPRLRPCPSTPDMHGTRKMGRAPRAINYRTAVETLERTYLTLLKILAQQDEVRADLQLLISELANLIQRDNGRSR